jgi:hypothetical protein
MATAGRPSSFKPEFVEMATKLCMLGLTDKELATVFDVSEKTLNTWKTKHTEFLVALKAGKVIADANVAHSLYQLATGYSHASEEIFIVQGKVRRVKTVKQYAPNAAAGIFWTRNRRKENWRNVIEPTDTGDEMPEAVKFTFEVIDGRKTTDGQADAPAG